jgi:hypothetical protein
MDFVALDGAPGARYYPRPSGGMATRSRGTVSYPGSIPGWASKSTSVPIPKFASACGTSSANFGIKGTLATFDSSAVFEFEVPTRACSNNDRNFKFTALVVLQPIDLDVDAVAKVTAISRAGNQQFASLLCAVRLDAPFLEARDKHGGVERPWLRLLL